MNIEKILGIFLAGLFMAADMPLPADDAGGQDRSIPTVLAENFVSNPKEIEKEPLLICQTDAARQSIIAQDASFSFFLLHRGGV